MNIIIDGLSLAYRTWFSPQINEFKDLEDDPKDLEENIDFFIYCFLKQIIKIDKELLKLKPKRIKTFICWDGLDSCKYRREIYPQYKNNRLKKDQRDVINIKVFTNYLRKVLKKVNPRFSLDFDFLEADDLIAILCDLFKNDYNCVVTRDKDFYQLISPETFMYNPFTEKLIREKDVLKELKVTPINISTYKAICGDNSDNYPGIKGYGPKKALDLISQGLKELNPQQLSEYTKSRNLAVIPCFKIDLGEIISKLALLDFEKISDWDSLYLRFSFEKEFQKRLNNLV